MNKVIVVIRRNKNYTPWIEIDNKIQWWNEVFKIPFLEFRRELSNIAFNNHDEIQADKIYYTIEEFQDDKDLIQPQDWIIPIDDDDWLCDDVCSKIRDIDTKEDLISWQCNVISIFQSKGGQNWNKLERIKNHIKINHSIPGFTFSCCYGLRNTTATLENIYSHMEVSNLDRQYISNLESCYISLPQSTMCLYYYVETKDALKQSVKEVELLDENLLSHRPEFVSKLRLIKDLFKQL